MLLRSLLFVTILCALPRYSSGEPEGAFTLADAYAAAIRSFESVKISEESVVQAGSRVDQALTYVYPRLTASGGYTRYNEILPPGGGSFIFQPRDQVQASLVLTQPLYTGGRTLAALRAARTVQKSSRSDLAEEKQTVLLNVAEAYYGVLTARKVFEASRGSLARMERHRTVTEREAATRRTKANASALLRANSLVSHAKILLLRAEDGLKLARQNLGLLTRLPEDAVLIEPASLPAVDDPFEVLQETAFRNREDLKSSRMQMEIAKEFVTITKGGHYPQVYAEGGVRYQDSDPRTGLDATTYYGGIRVQIPLFEGGLMRSEVAEARSRQRQAAYAAELLKRTIANQVREALLNYRSLAAVLQTAREQYQFARSNFDTIEELFGDGLVPSLSLIDAQQALFQAEQELISAQYEQQLSILRLQRAQGLLGRVIPPPDV